jgi:nucleotide-binding universal stress UspA family protein
VFRAILVPLDGSPFAEQALPYALAIARRARASLDLVHTHVSYALQEPAASWVPFDPAMEAQSRTDEQLYLAGTARWLAAVTPVPATTAVLPGPLVDPTPILERARTSNADLIVMATHGRGPLGRFFLGSVSDQVVRQVEVPVLLIGPHEPRRGLIPEPQLENVLVPLDGSALAEGVLGPAAELARLMEARCTLVRVIVPADVQTPVEVEARAYLERVAGGLRRQGLLVQTHVALGRVPADAILERARALRCDLIALATHGLGGVRRMVLGSVADQVIRGSSYPVLVCRPRAE